MPTRSLGFQSFYQAQLTSAISNTDLTIPLDVLPTPSEGILVIESTVAAKREIIYYTSKTSSAVVCPAGGRGYDGTTAVSHLQNSAVIMAPVAQMFKSLQDGTSMSSTVTLDNVVANTLSVGGQTPTADWSQLASAPNTVAANGNRSYTLTFNGVDYTGTMQPGTRVRTTRTVSAPTQCTSLNGTTQYFNKTSPAGMTFTNNFVVSAWVKLTSYSTNAVIASRYNGTSGWTMQLSAAGQINLFGFNGGVANYFLSQSYQSLPLNKWVHVAAQLDMTTTSTGGTNNYMMFDGVEVPNVCSRAGTNPTALVQAGNLEIGSTNGGAATTFWPGKIAQVAIYNAKVTQATIAASISQGLAGTETSLISAYSFNNTINDLNTTNANNLTANGSAVATNADSPYGGQARGNISSTLDYGIVQSISFSTNTTAVVQVPEGNTIPTSGGVSALYYSSAKAPYGMATSTIKWEIENLKRTDTNQTPVSGTTYNTGNMALNIPIGQFDVSFSAYAMARVPTTATGITLEVGLSTATNTLPDIDLTATQELANILTNAGTLSGRKQITLTSATVYYLNFRGTASGINNLDVFGSRASSRLAALTTLL